MFDEPFQTRCRRKFADQRFPFTFPTPGSPANKTLDYSVYLPISYSPGYSIHNRLPYAEDYNFTIQRELSKSTVLTLAYVGTQGHRLIAQYAANPGQSGALSSAERAWAQPPRAVRMASKPPIHFRTEDRSSAQATTLGPAFGSENTFTANIANSNYNSLQVSVERKASDVTFLAAYTYGKAIDNSSGFGEWVNFTNYRLSRSLSSFDVTHNFVASYNWAIPFDRAFPERPEALDRRMAVSVGISRFASGFPITMRQGSGISL